MRLTLLLLALAIMIAFPCVSCAWDYVYDGSVLPSDPSLGPDRWVVGGVGSSTESILAMCTTDGDALRIRDTSSDGYVYFFRDAPPAFTPVTMKSRVRVTSDSEQPTSM